MRDTAVPVLRASGKFGRGFLLWAHRRVGFWMLYICTCVYAYPCGWGRPSKTRERSELRGLSGVQRLAPCELAILMWHTHAFSYTIPACMRVHLISEEAGKL